MKPTHFKVVGVSNLLNSDGTPILSQKVCESYAIACNVAKDWLNPSKYEVYNLHSVSIFPIYKPF